MSMCCGRARGCRAFVVLCSRGPLYRSTVVLAGPAHDRATRGQCRYTGTRVKVRAVIA
jgi:hypothetical protein